MCKGRQLQERVCMVGNRWVIYAAPPECGPAPPTQRFTWTAAHAALTTAPCTPSCLAGAATHTYTHSSALLHSTVTDRPHDHMSVVPHAHQTAAGAGA